MFHVVIQGHEPNRVNRKLLLRSIRGKCEDEATSLIKDDELAIFLVESDRIEDRVSSVKNG